MVMEPFRKDADRIRKVLPTPQTLRDILVPPLPLRIRYQREGIRQIQEMIDFYRRHESQLSDFFLKRETELLILREQAVKRLAEMRPRR